MAKGFNNIILGTVQFGVPYGRRVGLPVLDRESSEDIMDLAWDLGIRKFDTAESYGDASNILASWLKKRSHYGECEISTKISSNEVDNINVVTNACSKFTNNCYLTLMSHGAVPYEKWDAFVLNCDNLNVNAGQSIYLISEMMEAEELGAAVIQMPCNFLETEKLKKINASRVRIDVRSIYLQGLFLEEPDHAEKRVISSRQMVKALRDLANACGTPLAPLLLRSVLDQIRDHDNIVVGIDSASQLFDIDAAFKLTESVVREFIFLATKKNILQSISNAEYLFDPRRWNQ